MRDGRPWNLRRGLALLVTGVLPLLSSVSLCVSAQEAGQVTSPPLVDPLAKNVTLSMGCPEFLSAFYEANVSSTKPYRSFTITKGGGYAYFQLHFTQLWLPPGCSVLLRGVENVNIPDTVLNLTELFPSGQQWKSNFTSPVLAKELQIEFYREVGPALATGDVADIVGSSADVVNARHCYGFVIDSYDYELVDRTRNITASNEATCANDNSKEAICYYADSSTRTEYLAARTVARLLIKKEDGTTAACTGWLLGSEGHLLTNYHCVSSQFQASSITVEFMADASSCSQVCTAWGDCRGTVEAITSTLVRANESLDYALLKLETNVNLPKKYGFLRLKATTGRVGQEIYIPQHPLYAGKRIAMVNDYGTKTTILNTAAEGCNTTGYSYNGDTQGGSSGSPVIDAQDHGVVALHHCGQMCSNTGIQSVDILADMENAGVLPQGAVDSGDGRNAANFPTFQPAEETAPPVLTYKRTFDRRITKTDVRAMWAGSVEAYKWRVSVDQYIFTLLTDAEISVDVLAYEVSNDGVYTDLNGDCNATYVDTVMYLFRQGDPTPVVTSDDAPLGKGTLDGSVSTRDPFIQTFLKAGTYVVAIGSMPIKQGPAFAGESFLSYDPEIYSCKDYGLEGSYRVQFNSSSDTLDFVEPVPQNVTLLGTCGVKSCMY